MKIVHICLTGPFTDGVAYQENELIKQHIALDHHVFVIATTESYGFSKEIINVRPGKYILDEGAVLFRLPHKFLLKGRLGAKVRAHRGLLMHLDSIKPDLIFFHGLCAWDLLVVANYIRANTSVKLICDCHEDFNNSARTWASREILHKHFYKRIFQSCINQITEVLCVTPESLIFAIEFYGSPISKTRLYPLGGALEDPESINERRVNFRYKFGIDEFAIVIVQTGRLNYTKKLYEALLSFTSNASPNLIFIIAGQMTQNVYNQCFPIIQADRRILNLGWQSTDDLKSVLAGSDFFLQPFGQTATTQLAICYGCAILLQDLPSHRWLFENNGKLFKDASELTLVFKWVEENQKDIFKFQKASYAFAKKNLDYRQLASQILQ